MAVTRIGTDGATKLNALVHTGFIGRVGFLSG
jgi:hypothetical protein